MPPPPAAPATLSPPTTGSGRSARGRPDFLVIGAGKAGTTTLFYSLEAQPGVHAVRRKEPRFFCFDGPSDAYTDPPWFRLSWITDPAEYASLFAGAPPGTLAGEASTWYLTTPGTAPRIRTFAPEARTIAVLRHPVDRAYSHWAHCRREGAEPLGFEDAIAAEAGRRAAGWSPHWHYLAQSTYPDGLESYFSTFPPDQVRVFLFEELVRDPRAVLSACCAFLGLAPPAATSRPAARLNTGGLPISTRLQRSIERRRWQVREGGRLSLGSRASQRFAEVATRLNTRPLPPLAADTRARLLAHFDASIVRTGDIIGRDLSAWRE